MRVRNGVLRNVPLMTLKEAAASLHISLRTLHRLVAADAFPTVQIGRRRLVRQAALEDYVAALEPAKGH